MKKFTFILTSMLFLLVGGVFSQSVTTLYLDKGNNRTLSNESKDGSSNVIAADVLFTQQGINEGSAGLTGTNWVASYNEGETHTFTVTLSEAPGSDNFSIYVGSPQWNFGQLGNGYEKHVVIPADKTTASISISKAYTKVYIFQTKGSNATLKIASITRTITTASSNGKTAVTYNIPGKNVIFSDSFDSNINNWAIWNGNEYNGSVNWDNTTGHDSNGCMKVVNNESRPSDQYKIQRHASLSNISKGTTFFVTFYIKCESGTGSIRCSTTGHAQYQGDQNVTTEWKKIKWEVTAEGDINGLCLDMAHTANTYYIDDVEVYTNADTGGSNVFTSDEQVANIASSAFSGLNAGDYICADVTGTPGTIKLTCNGTDYTLTQFNGGTLWGIKVTAEMATALKAYASEFKGYPLTLNSIDIYKTVALGEGANEISLYNNVFVELTRSFVADNWNTVCLPFVPTPAQATELFGSGYKLAKFTASDTNKMTFTTIDLDNEEFVAGKPYLVYPTENLAHSNKVLANVSITETEGSEDGDNEDKGYKFKGSFEPTTFSSNLSKYRFIASGNELKIPTGGTLKSLRCYFEYPSGGNARSFVIDEEGGTTGINAVNGEGFMVNGYYNLNGQRVAQPTKGLYIVNGKKVVIK